MRLWKKSKMNTSSINTLIDGIPFAAVVTTADADNPVIIAANYLHEKLTGYNNDDIIGKSPRLFKGPLTSKKISDEIKIELRDSHFSNVDIVNHRPDGTPYQINLTIIGAVVDGKSYYVALKQATP